MKFVAVTACPTGIAHSQMAAENVENTAESMGHEIKVEVQGAMGAENELTEQDIADADAVIIAADTSVQRDRFENVPVVKGTVKDGVNDAEGLIQRAVEAADGEDAEASAETDTEPTTEADDAAGTETDDDRQQATAGTEPEERPATESAAENEQGGLLTRIKQMFS